MTVKITNDYTASHSIAPKEIVGSPFTVTVDSDPKKSRVYAFATTHIAGNLYEMTIESRDANDINLDSTFDVYSVQLKRSDGGGSQEYLGSAVYQSAGLYKVKLTPTIAGQYTMTVTIANDYTAFYPSASTQITNSPFIVTVYPG